MKTTLVCLCVRLDTVPVVDEYSVGVYLVLQGEVKGEVFCMFVVVSLHSRGILIRLQVMDDIREPHR